jgi:S1-C subfamily serine protease
MKRTLFTLTALFVLGAMAHAQPAALVLKQEADRVAVVAKVKPTVVAIFARGGQGGGTGVLINDEGYALTNFHVVQPTGPTMQCGLANGILYDAVLVGLDKVGDVALIKLLPKKDGDKFPFAPMGDSDLVKEGDWSIAMGNPFLLATDFTPTVTFGLVSGVQRYQPPAGLFLEYTNCIQIDTSINPGNSGGPLYNLKGEIIGINGRGSFDKRGRINSGVGYAISINQIKNFMGHLRAGLDSDHASLGALVRTETETAGIGKTRVTTILDECDAARRGLQADDEILSFAGHAINNDNHYKNILGIFPREWRVPLEYQRGDAKKEILVRLMGMQKKELPDGSPPDPKDPKDKQPKGKGGAPQGPAAKFYEPKAGFANYYFNKKERERLLAEFKKTGDFAALPGTWTIDGDVRLLKGQPNKFTATLKDDKVNKSEKPVVSLKIGAFTDTIEPLHDLDIQGLRKPDRSGGMMPALFVWRELLLHGDKTLSDVVAGGMEPFYPPPSDNSTPKNWNAQRVDAEVLISSLSLYRVKWFFAKTDHKLLGFEVRINELNEDPCEVYFSDYRAVNGRQLPHRMQVYYKDALFGTFTVTDYKMAAN